MFSIPAKYLCLQNVNIHFIWPVSPVQRACFICLVFGNLNFKENHTTAAAEATSFSTLSSALHPDIIELFCNSCFHGNVNQVILCKEEEEKRCEKTGGEQFERAGSLRGSHFPQPCLRGRNWKVAVAGQRANKNSVKATLAQWKLSPAESWVQF